jgi:uncharacterized protein (TIGR00730 family)
MGRELVRSNIGLVYGGGNVGLMGIIADAVLRAGGEAQGVIPENLIAREVGHNGLTKLYVVHSMHERKALMADLSDAFVALPGGFGTLEEFCEVVTWTQLGLHAKPCALYVAVCVDGFAVFIGAGVLLQCHSLIADGAEDFLQSCPHKSSAKKKRRPFNEPPRTANDPSLRCYSDVMEGRGDGLKRLNLGRSIDHSCQGFQHFCVGSGVVSFCIGFALPQTDRNHIHAAGI